MGRVALLNLGPIGGLAGGIGSGLGLRMSIGGFVGLGIGVLAEPSFWLAGELSIETLIRPIAGLSFGLSIESVAGPGFGLGAGRLARLGVGLGSGLIRGCGRHLAQRCACRELHERHGRAAADGVGCYGRLGKALDVGGRDRLKAQVRHVRGVACLAFERDRRRRGYGHAAVGLARLGKSIARHAGLQFLTGSTHPNYHGTHRTPLPHKAEEDLAHRCSNVSLSS